MLFSFPSLLARPIYKLEDSSRVTHLPHSYSRETLSHASCLACWLLPWALLVSSQPARPEMSVGALSSGMTGLCQLARQIEARGQKQRVRGDRIPWGGPSRGGGHHSDGDVSPKSCRAEWGRAGMRQLDGRSSQHKWTPVWIQEQGFKARSNPAILGAHVGATPGLQGLCGERPLVGLPSPQ